MTSPIRIIFRSLLNLPADFRVNVRYDDCTNELAVHYLKDCLPHSISSCTTCCNGKHSANPPHSEKDWGPGLAIENLGIFQKALQLFSHWQDRHVQRDPDMSLSLTEIHRQAGKSKPPKQNIRSQGVSVGPPIQVWTRFRTSLPLSELVTSLKDF